MKGKSDMKLVLLYPQISLVIVNMFHQVPSPKTLSVMKLVHLSPSTWSTRIGSEANALLGLF
jgi:hypothetical protein